MKDKKEKSTDNVRSEISNSFPPNLQYQFSVDQISRVMGWDNLDENIHVTIEHYGSKSKVVKDPSLQSEETNDIKNNLNAQNRVHGNGNDCISKDISRKDERKLQIRKQSCQSLVKPGLTHDDLKRNKQMLNEIEKQDSEKDVDDLDMFDLKEDEDTSKNDENKKLEKVKGLLVQENFKEDKKNQEDDKKPRFSPDEEKIADTVDNKIVHDLRNIRSTCDEETSLKSGVDPDLQQQGSPLKVDLPEKEENEISEGYTIDAVEYEGAIEHSWRSECDTQPFIRMNSTESVECRDDGAELGRTEEIKPHDLDIEKELLLNSVTGSSRHLINMLLKVIRQISGGKNQCTTCGQASPEEERKQFLSGHQPCDGRTCIRSERRMEKPDLVGGSMPGKNQSEVTLSDKEARSRQLVEKEAQTDQDTEELEKEENGIKGDSDSEGDQSKYVELDNSGMQTVKEKVEDYDNEKEDEEDRKREQEDREEINFTDLTSKGEQTVAKIEEDQIKEVRVGERHEKRNKEGVEKFETETKEKKEDKEKDTEEEINDKLAVDAPGFDLSGKTDITKEQDRNKVDNVEAEEEKDLQPSSEKNELNNGKMVKFVDCSSPIPNSDKNKKRKKSKGRSVNYEKQKFEQKLRESSVDHKALKQGRVYKHRDGFTAYHHEGQHANLEPKKRKPVLAKIPNLKPADCDIYIPKTKRQCRRVQMLQRGSYGRRCSDSGSNSAGAPNGRKGSRNNDDKQGRGNEKESKDLPEKNSDQRKEREDQNGPNEGDRKENAKSNDRNSPNPVAPKRRLSDVSLPQPNSKRVRKKHSSISVEHWEKFLGFLKQRAEARGCPCWDLDQNPVADCLANCMENLDDLPDYMLECFVCLTINSLMKHYANCIRVYMTCNLCTQIFSLICCHVNQCIQTSNNFNKRVDLSISICEIPLCDKIRLTLSGADISGHLKMLWFNIRKKLTRVMGDTELHDERRSSVTMAPMLESIRENETVTSIPNSRQGSRILSRKKSKLTIVGETDESPDKSASAENHGAFSIELDQTAVHEGIKGRVVSKDRHISLPMGPPRTSEGQFSSFIDRPVGIKGIGEVVYGDKIQLAVVAQHWDTKKRDFQENGKLPTQFREEGVILEKYKDMLIIGTTRYQEDFQWIRASHLGNGITSKCYLATDFETEAQFCVKEIHISNYEMEEILLWADLDHSYIVTIYGAIRFGEKIFIFMEYIAGGCLTEAINHQKKLGQRLSQKTALRYFKQLLQVLCYLKYKNILNEDLKGDNILLHKEGKNVSIKVTDFGVARRCQGQVRKGTKPMGTQTQWSPEKAEATGYGFPAEVWAAVCVLVHMLSGTPPWIRRFGNIKTLIIVIVNHSPPIEDIPRNISNSVRDLIERGFTVCSGTRPTPEQLLLHPAFSLLEDGVTTEAYSILPTVYHDNADIEDDENKDLKEIYRKLSDTSSGVKNSHIVPPSSPVQVYTLLNSTTQGCNATHGQQNGAAANVANQEGGVINQGDEAINQRDVAVNQENGAREQGGGDLTDISVGLEVPGPSGYQSNINDAPRSKEMKTKKPSPSDPYQNMDYTKHFLSYLHDTSPPRFPGEPVNRLVEYNPDSQILPEQPVQEPFPDFRYNEEFRSRIPNFNMLLQSEEFELEREDSGDEEENIFQDFDLDVAIRQMNLSAINDGDVEEEKSKESKAREEKDAVEGLASERSAHTIKDKEITPHFITDNKMMTHAVNDNERSTQTTHVRNKNDATSSASSVTLKEAYQPSQEKILDGFNEDYLFISGSPKSNYGFDFGTKKYELQPSYVEGFDPSNFPGSSGHKTSPSHMADQGGSHPQDEARPPLQPHAQHAGSAVSYEQNNPAFLYPQQRLESPHHDQHRMTQIRQPPSSWYIYQPQSSDETQINQSESRLTSAQGQGQTGMRSPQSPLYIPQDYRYNQTQPHSYGQERYSTPGTSTRPQIQEAQGTSMPGFPQQATVDRQSASYVPNEIIIPPLPIQQGGKQNHLQLDMEKAKKGKSVSSSCAQTAPVSSPTKTSKLTSSPYNRMSSYTAPPPRRTSVSTPSPGPKSLTSKLLFEEQECAYNELRDTAREALSQHDGSVIDYEEDREEEAIHPEFSVTSDVTPDEMRSMAVYYQDNETDTDSRIKVVFRRRGDSESEEIKMSFPKTSRDLQWETIIGEELSHHSKISYGLDRFCLKLEDGTLIDLDNSLGDENIVVYVEPADENDCWWVEKGVIMKSMGRN